MGASVVLDVGWRDGRGERVTVGIVVPALDDVVDGCTCSTWTGGLGCNGTNTGSLSMVDVSCSGCTSGRTARVAATAH